MPCFSSHLTTRLRRKKKRVLFCSCAPPPPCWWWHGEDERADAVSWSAAPTPTRRFSWKVGGSTGFVSPLACLWFVGTRRDTRKQSLDTAEGGILMSIYLSNCFGICWILTVQIDDDIIEKCYWMKVECYFWWVICSIRIMMSSPCIPELIGVDSTSILGRRFFLMYYVYQHILE